MEFWGIEIKAGAEVVCEPGSQTYLHLSQAALGETKKPQENVLIHVKVDDQDLVLATLSGDKFPQASFDIVFEKNFKVSHTSKSTSVYLTGYRSEIGEEDDDEVFSDSESEDEPMPVAPKPNGLVPGLNEASIKAAVKAKLKAKAEPKPEEDDEDSDDEEESDDDELSSDDDDISVPDAEGDDSDDDEDSSEEDVTPKKVETSKKRPSDSVSNSATPGKKAKLVTPAGKKTDDGKKGSLPVAKQTPKTAASEKSKQSPKSAGSSVSCKSCSKTFNSEKALESHSKAKHEAK